MGGAGAIFSGCDLAGPEEAVTNQLSVPHGIHVTLVIHLSLWPRPHHIGLRLPCRLPIRKPLPFDEVLADLRAPAHVHALGEHTLNLWEDKMGHHVRKGNNSQDI